MSKYRLESELLIKGHLLIKKTNYHNNTFKIIFKNIYLKKVREDAEKYQTVKYLFNSVSK